MSKHTPGPWFADAEGRIWRRDPSDLYQNGGGVAGDKPLAFVNAGWLGEGVTGYPVKENARLIAAAPDLLDALQDVDALWMHHSVAHGDGKISPLHEKVIAAIAKATGEQP